MRMRFVQLNATFADENKNVLSSFTLKEDLKMLAVPLEGQGITISTLLKCVFVLYGFILIAWGCFNCWLRCTVRMLSKLRT